MSLDKLSFALRLRGRLLLFLILQQLVSSAQQTVITGKVTNENGEPVSAVSVMLKGTKQGVVTNDEGIYNISVAESKATLVFTRVGYLKKEIPLSKATVINVELQTDPASMAPVVVIGYGTVKRQDMTGSVSSVNVKDLQLAPVKSFDEALAGRIAGVQVISSEGKPGSPIDIVIRGGNSVTQSNAPLFVIDGFPIEDPSSEDANPIHALDPADIESIDVLKDASATAIYGARGANGVVVITTKRGKTGRTNISYNSYYGWQESNKRLAVLDPYEFVKLQQEIAPIHTYNMYRVRTVDGVRDTLPLEYYKTVKGIDWENQIMRTAPIMNHHLSLSGGSAQTKHSASVSYMKQDGIVINSGFKRVQGRLTLDHNASDRLKVGVNAAYSSTKTHGTPTSSSNYNNELNLLFSVWAYRPIPLLNSDIDLLEEPMDPEIEQNADFRYNPIMTTQNEHRANFHDYLSANGYAEYSLLKSLKLKITGGLSRGNSKYEVFNNSLSRSGHPSTNNRVNGGLTYANNTTWLNENTLTYDKKLNAHQTLNVMGGMTFQGNYSNAFGAYAKLLPNENLGTSGLDEGTPLLITSNSSKWGMVSFYGRMNYNLKSKYLFTTTFRADGSSRFAPGNKWGYFPSAAFAWRLGSEKFIKNIEAISDAKLRISWGVTGNNSVGNFSYFPGYSVPLSAGYSFNNQLNNGSYPSSMGNEDLKWESTAQTDLGLDLDFLKGKIRFSADVYRKQTTDLLLNANLPNSTGYNSQFKNIGKVRNEGLELSLWALALSEGNFRWSTNFNISFNRNKVLALADNELSMLTSQYWGDDWVLIPGYIARIGGPVSAFYGHIWDGVYTYEDFEKVGDNYILKDHITANGEPRSAIKPGDIKYRDLNGDRVVDNYDKTVIGNPLPKHTGGLSNNFSYKGFDLNVFFQWSYGNDIYNANKFMLSSGYKYNTNQYASYINRWSPENPDSKIPAAKGTSMKTYSTWLVEDGSFLRLKTVSLGYNLPERMIRSLRIESARVYFSAQNLHTWTNYSGYDPEVSVRNSALTRGFDYSAYPRAKTTTVGLKVTF